MSAPREQALAVHGLRVRYGQRLALDGLDLDVSRGEVVAVLGPSGSGKSTLLRAIVGLVDTESGSIRSEGRELSTAPAHRRGVGLMFQDNALFGHLDVGGNVAYGLRMQGARRAERATRVQEVLELVGLPDAGRRSVASLSGGERQRVALARCLAPRPAVVMLDEPFGSLDRALRDRLVADLANLFGELDQTVLLVTHDRDEAFALADRLVVLDAGLLVQQGPPASLWRRPRTEVVARLLGLNGIVTLEVTAGRAAAPWGPVRLDRPDGTARVLVHPAGVEVRRPGRRADLPPGRAAHTFTAAVESVRFRGDRSEVTVRPSGAWAEPATLSAFVDGEDALRVGDPVEVLVRPGALVPLAAPGAGSDGAGPGATRGTP